MMAPFEYANPATIAEAIELLGGGGVPLAGGTDLLALMKDRIVAPSRVVDLRGIGALARIDSEAGGLAIGAAVSLDALAAHDAARRLYPSLTRAIDGIRSPQIRAMATVGGDLCQRPRCWYFRSGFGLLGWRDGGSLPAQGDNRYHAILGNSGRAVFVNPSGLAPGLIALEAEVVIAGPKGERRLPVAHLYRTPSREDEREIALDPGEIVARVVIPAPRGRANAVYEVRPHASLDWPLATAAVSIAVDGGTVREARVVLGHVAPVPWRAAESETVLVGKRLDATTAREAGRAAVAGAKPLARNGYKVTLASVAVARALLRAAGKETA